jgi:hypothetical protein
MVIKDIGMGKHSGPENQAAERDYVENGTVPTGFDNAKAYAELSSRADANRSAPEDALTGAINGYGFDRRAEDQTVEMQTPKAKRVHNLAEYTNPIGRHAAERVNLMVPEATVFYDDMMDEVERFEKLWDKWDDWNALSVMRENIRNRSLKTETMLFDQKGEDPKGEQRVRSAIDLAVVKAAEFLAVQPTQKSRNDALLFEVASPDNRMTSLITQDIDAIMGAHPDGQETTGQYETAERRPMDTYVTKTEFPGIELVYQYIKPDERTKEAARLRVWLDRPTGETTIAEHSVEEVQPPTPVMEQAEAPESTQPKRRLSLRSLLTRRSKKQR